MSISLWAAPPPWSTGGRDGGYTENSGDVWNTTQSRLRGKPDPTGRPQARWRVTLTDAQFSQDLTSACHPFAALTGIAATAFTAVGHRIKALTVTGLTPAGQPTAVSNADNVGLSQEGAGAMANSGRTFQNILDF